MKVYYDNDVLSRLVRTDETGPESDALMLLQALCTEGRFTKVTSRLSWREQQRAPVEQTRVALKQNRRDSPIVKEDWVRGSYATLEEENGSFASWYTGTHVVDEDLYRSLLNFGLKEEDACHLMYAVHNLCETFLTLDKHFLGTSSNSMRGELEKLCRGLRILKPSELLAELNLSAHLPNEES